MDVNAAERRNGSAGLGSFDIDSHGPLVVLCGQYKDEVAKMSIADELEKLSNLKNQGVLSDEEFQAQKARILQQPAVAGEEPFVGRPAFISNPGPSDKAAQNAAIGSEVKRLNSLSLVLGLSGLGLQVYGRASEQTSLTVLGVLLFIGGLVMYAKMRGRHPALGLLGLLSCLGMLILYLLDKKCLGCGKVSARSEAFCADCGAPLGS